MQDRNFTHRLVAGGLIAATILLANCRTDSPTAVRDGRTSTAQGAALAAASIDPALPILVGAGNIATCNGTGDEATAAILDTVGGTVFTTGDNVNTAKATLVDYTNCYGPSWGRHRSRTRPTAGDKDTGGKDAGAFFTYFGGKSVVGDSAKYYYSYDVGSWHVIVLNSGLSMNTGTPQDVWLKADIAAHPASCTAAIWDQPRFFSGGAARGASLPAWNVLYNAGVDLIINGHQGNYERFAPQTPTGVANASYGIREIVAGTGGALHGPLGTTPAANSEVRNNTAYGVLQVTLGDGRYDWHFLPAAPSTFSDSGGTLCHAVPGSAAPPTAVPGGPYASEGLIQFDGSQSNDPGGNTPLTYRWTYGDGSPAGTGATPTHTYALGNYTATLVVTNSVGVSSVPATTSVAISNVPPTVSAGPDVWKLPNTAFTLNASFSDPGNDGPFPWTIDWGDGSALTNGKAPGVGAITANHTYKTASRFTLTLAVTDAHGGTRADTIVVATDQPNPSAPILIGAGDIAQCGTHPVSESTAEQTAKLLDAEVAANPGAIVYTLGDNAYDSSSVTEMLNCYGPTWGRHNARVRPVVGNHEYLIPDAAGYWQYFTYNATPAVFVGDSARYYYSYDVGTWHIIVFNDNIETKVGTPQVNWLQADLAAHPAKCTLAMWHKPKYYQGGARTNYASMWTPLYNAGAELVLNGHVHRYERYAEMTPGGIADPGRGIREIIVGTGGANLGTSTDTPPNLEVVNGTTFGVLKLWLDTDGYYWKFIPIAGQTFTDMGYTACH